MEGPSVTETQPLTGRQIPKTGTKRFIQNEDDDGGLFSNVPVRSFVVACLANLYEYYDFALLGFFANQVGAALFPTGSDVTYAIEVYGLYAVGFLFRPFGGAFFGYMGDKIGRKNALRLAMIMMAFPTFLTGCLPTYDIIGWWAPALLLLFRIIQGLSTGGENSNVATYVYEIARDDKKAFFMSMLGVSTSGTLVASLIQVIVSSSLSESSLYSFGWRIPFWLGLGLIFVAIWGKKHMQESNTFRTLRNNDAIVANPLRHGCTNHFDVLIKFTFVSALQHCSAYATYVFLPSYLSSASMRGWSDSWAYGINAINSTIALPLILLVGYGTDLSKHGAIKFLYPGFVLTFLMAPVVFYGFSQVPHGMVWMDWFLQFLMTIVLSLVHGCMYYWYLSALLRDPRSRVTLFGLGYNLGAAMFGGTASLIGSAFVAAEGSVVGVSLLGCWVSFLSCVSLSLVCFVQRGIEGNEKYDRNESDFSKSLVVGAQGGGSEVGGDFVDVTDFEERGEYEVIDTDRE